MELKDIIAAATDPATLARVVRETRPTYDLKEALQYEPENHEVRDDTVRKKKKVFKPTGKLNADLTPKMEETIQEVNRVTTSLQKLIVERAVAFTAGVPIEALATPKDKAEEQLLDMVKKSLTDNKTTFKDATILECTMKDKESAEIWSSEEAEPGYWGTLAGVGGKFKMRIKICAPSLGDLLYPVYNSIGDMIAFGRQYKVFEGKDEVNKLDVYTAERAYKLTERKGIWTADKPVEYSYGKIPVIYHPQKKTEWADVQGKIDRLETLLSNHADTNDYNGSPILGVTGKVEGFSEKGEQGKIITMNDGASIKYITWDHAPESIKMEIENLIDFIYTETRTPNISFKEMKGLGAISGIALKLLFLDAHLKAKNKQSGQFGEGIQRRFNFLKSAMAAINEAVRPATNMDITPKFGLYMPDNQTEKIENFVQLVTSGILSKTTALELLGKDLGLSPQAIEEEYERLKTQNDALNEPML